MFKNIEKKLRHLWHELYYNFSSEQAVKFALTCKEATAKLDLPSDQLTVSDRFRLLLHTSLCQACSNYKTLTLALRKYIKILVKKNEYSNEKIEKLNQTLIEKYGKK